MDNINPLVTKRIGEILDEISKIHKRGIDDVFDPDDVWHITKLQNELKEICGENNIAYSILHNEIYNDFKKQIY